MEIYGLVGDPVEHSLSPLIHNTISGELALDCEYRLFHVRERLGERIKELYSEGVRGLNITVPYKSEVMPYLKAVDPPAEAIGAVNTLKAVSGGYTGYNTDIEGLRRVFEKEAIKIDGSDFIVLGAGGAARAAAFMLLTGKALSITLVNRSTEKAEELARSMKDYCDKSGLKAPSVGVLGLDELDALTGESYVAIQCTSVGLSPASDHAVTESADFYKRLSFAVDVVYSPKVTRFMQLCRQYGVRCVNGLGMLLYQAVCAYEIWHGVKVPENVTETVYGMLSRSGKRGIVLTGLMGAGKTTVGKMLADRLSWRFVDTDVLIEEREGKSINEIFKENGEEYFRELETAVIREISENCGKEGTVVSTGGGLVVRECNRSYLKKTGTVVYLRASKETLLKRIRNTSDRPLLKGDMEGRLESLLLSRGSIYEAVSDVIIDTDGMSTEEVVLKGERLI